MALNKKLIHFKTWNNFISQDGVNGDYSTPSSGKESDGTAVYGQLLGTSIVFIKDVQKIWTHGRLYDSVSWSEIDENTAVTSNEKLYEILNSVYDPVTELDSKTATTRVAVSLLNQTY